MGMACGSAQPMVLDLAPGRISIRVNGVRWRPMPMPAPARLSNAAAKSVLKPLGCIQKGCSRIWLDDQSYWVIGGAPRLAVGPNVQLIDAATGANEMGMLKRVSR